ncbi:hypothetical protein B0H12DRAFT_1130766 [Mycena haematopus]|nr:hypothetical protein B0H12DRAFT_1130766 [Mycena haematopus]
MDKDSLVNLYPRWRGIHDPPDNTQFQAVLFFIAHVAEILSSVDSDGLVVHGNTLICVGRQRIERDTAGLRST